MKTNRSVNLVNVIRVTLASLVIAVLGQVEYSACNSAHARLAHAQAQAARTMYPWGVAPGDCTAEFMAHVR